MQCYKQGGCGIYESLPCNECPASKPEYLKGAVNVNNPECDSQKERDIKMLKIEFYWDDLTESKKKEILNLLGENCNWDVLPFCILYVEKSEDGEDDA